MRILLQPAFVLHHRPLRETSLILEVFTEEYGRLSLIARGIRSRHSPLKALLQPLVPLLISWQGKTELMNLTKAEAQGLPFALKGDNLLSSFYLNELLMRLLQKQDPHPKLFSIYKNTLQRLISSPLNVSVLRIFEKNLLEELGYALSMRMDFSTGEMIFPEKHYHFYPDIGFKITEDNVQHGFKGEHLLAFANEALVTKEQLHNAKRLMRIAFASLLDNNALKSRDLFQREK